MKTASVCNKQTKKAMKKVKGIQERKNIEKINGAQNAQKKATGGKKQQKSSEKNNEAAAERKEAFKKAAGVSGSMRAVSLRVRLGLCALCPQGTRRSVCSGPCRCVS